MNREAWNKIDEGLQALMEGNDQEGDVELREKTRRLTHLGKFCGRLAQRVNERLREGCKQGGLDALFRNYQAERQAIDEN